MPRVSLRTERPALLLSRMFRPVYRRVCAITRIFANMETAAGPQFQWPSTNGGGTSISPPAYGTAYFGTGNAVNWKDPYSMQWDLSIDHDFGKGIGTRISYIGMKTDDLVWGPDANNMSYSRTTPAEQRPL